MNQQFAQQRKRNVQVPFFFISLIVSFSTGIFFTYFPSVAIERARVSKIAACHPILDVITSPLIASFVTKEEKNLLYSLSRLNHSIRCATSISYAELLLAAWELSFRCLHSVAPFIYIRERPFAEQFRLCTNKFDRNCHLRISRKFDLFSQIVLFHLRDVVQFHFNEENSLVRSNKEQCEICH